MNLESHHSAQAVAQRAADEVAKLLARKPEAVLLLPAGGTPVPLYVELLHRQATGALDLARAHFFQLDELVGVGRDDERSFHHFLRRELLDELRAGAGRSAERDHLLDGRAADPRAAIAEHGRKLQELGGADLALLGIGRNGHVAFNEPGASLGDGARFVELAEATVAGLRKSFQAAELPTTGITLGMREIGASKGIVLVATGSGKASILEVLVRNAPSTECPASLLIERPGFLVLADEDAAVRLGALET